MFAQPASAIAATAAAQIVVLHIGVEFVVIIDIPLQAFRLREPPPAPARIVDERAATCCQRRVNRRVGRGLRTKLRPPDGG
jgi:hypothetical protein